MTRWLPVSLLTAFLAAGCATAPAPAPSSASFSKAAQEDYVLGSRLRRSESNENYQGTKSVTRQDYQEYKASTSLKGGN